MVGNGAIGSRVSWGKNETTSVTVATRALHDYWDERRAIFCCLGLMPPSTVTTSVAITNWMLILWEHWMEGFVSVN